MLHWHDGMCLGLVAVGGEQIQARCSLSLNRKVTLLAQPVFPNPRMGLTFRMGQTVAAFWVLSLLLPTHPVSLFPSGTFQFLKTSVLLFMLRLTS